MLLSGAWTYCFLADEPVRVGEIAVHSLRRDPSRFDYSGRMVMDSGNGQRWIVVQDLVTFNLDAAPLKDLISPKIVRLPGLVVTFP
jgi:hypothetical protein